MTALDDAWQAALASEHQAVFGYSLLGPRLDGTDRRRAVSCSDAHESVRDATGSALSVAGLVPVTAEADYPALYPVPDAAAAQRLAVVLEDACSAAWRYLFARAAGSSGARATTLRSAAQKQLTGSAVRAVQWRVVVDPAKATTAFPGI